MQFLKAINLGLAFFLELGMLAATAYAGYHVHGSRWIKLVIAIGAPLLIAVLWGRWAAPMSDTRLKLPWLAIFQVSLFGLSALALWRAGQPKWALVLIVLEAICEALILIWKQ